MRFSYRIIVPFLTFRKGISPHFFSFLHFLAPTKRYFLTVLTKS